MRIKGYLLKGILLAAIIAYLVLSATACTNQNNTNSPSEAISENGSVVNTQAVKEQNQSLNTKSETVTVSPSSKTNTDSNSKENSINSSKPKSNTTNSSSSNTQTTASNSSSNTTAGNAASTANSNSTQSNPVPGTQTKPVSTKPYVMIGDSENEVVRIMGKPSISNDYGYSPELDYWYNGSSCIIYFYNKGDGYKVIGWSNYENFLKVSMGTRSSSAPPITVGSSKDDVIKACGTPFWNSPFFGIKNDDFPDWKYDDGSWVKFGKDYKVIGWHNKGALKVTLGQIDPNAPSVKKGSSIQDVLNALGTPMGVYNGGPTTQITNLEYPDCYFTFDNNGIAFDIINHGNLKVIN